MDERLNLNDEKRTLHGTVSEPLADLMVRVFRWQVFTRGLSPHAAFREAKEECDRLLEAVQGSVLTELERAYLDLRKDG